MILIFDLILWVFIEKRSEDFGGEEGVGNFKNLGLKVRSGVCLRWGGDWEWEEGERGFLLLFRFFVFLLLFLGIPQSTPSPPFKKNPPS